MGGGAILCWIIRVSIFDFVPSVGRVLTSPELIKLREARVVDVEFSLVFAVEAKV